MSIFKNILSHLLLAYSNLFGKNGIIILEYHRVSNNISDKDVHSITPGEFRAQLKYLISSGYSFISLSEVAEKLKNGYNKEDKVIALTFDDGHKDVINFALPIMEELNVKATIFIVSKYVGKNGWLNHNGDLSDTEANGDQRWELLSWSDLKNMSKYFWIEAHGMTHRRMSFLNKDQLEAELEHPLAKIEKKIGISPSAFCYPYGDCNQLVIDMTKNTGYTSACSTIKGINVPFKSNIWELKRNEVGRGLSDVQFRLLLTDGVRAYSTLSRIANAIKNPFRST
jgi:peptidoglycan/xylan/chitin deacetylase (PgdA/CDA1 family)